jgi:hypothetical protein
MRNRRTKRWCGGSPPQMSLCKPGAPVEATECLSESVLKNERWSMTSKGETPESGFFGAAVTGRRLRGEQTSADQSPEQCARVDTYRSGPWPGCRDLLGWPASPGPSSPHSRSS